MAADSDPMASLCSSREDHASAAPFDQRDRRTAASSDPISRLRSSRGDHATPLPSAQRVTQTAATPAGSTTPTPFFLHASLGFYLLATGLGLVLRTFFVFPFEGLVFANALHAHSHTLYFGWGALGILTLSFQRLGAAPRLFLASVVGISAATFLSFLQGGYSTVSIVISSLSLLIWIGAVTLFVKHGRGQRGIDIAFLRMGMVYLVLASFGAVARVILSAFDAPALYKSLAVFSFLNNFAWFFLLSVVGLLVSRASSLGVRFDEGLLRWQLRLSWPLAWLTFPLGVPGGADGILGALGRGAAIALLVPAALGALALWRAATSAETSAARWSLRWLAFWLGLEAILAAAGGFGLAGLAVHSRHLAILYLHVLLLGVVSLGLMIAVLSSLGARLAAGMWLHNAGLVIMSLGLAMAGLPAFGFALPEGLPRLGLILAAVGGAISFSAGIVWAAGALRTRARDRTIAWAGLPADQ